MRNETQQNGEQRRMLTLSWFCAFASLTLALSAGAKAKGTPEPQSSPDEPQVKVRLVSATQGRSIVETALSFEQPTPGSRDCSHLVREIYAAAGFNYPYASSFDLYAGNENFRRVKTPQPGDLIAWPGHVGIVLDPREHSFYSLVRSGLEAENYYGRYWRSRGHARFYRFVAAKLGTVETAEVEPPTLKRAPEIEARADTSAVTPRAIRERDTELPVKTASRRTAVIGPPAPRLLAEPADFPTSILITSEQRRPTQDEVAEAVSQLSNAAGNLLQGAETLKTKMPVAIFEHLSVERVEIKNDRGWAHLAVDSNVSINEEGADFKRRREKVRWELRRTESGWIAVAPTERAFVPREVAVRVLAARLAQLTESDASAQDDGALGQEGRIANLLSALLQTK